MIATPKVKFEENICELLLKTSTRARKKRTMRAFAPPHAGRHRRHRTRLFKHAPPPLPPWSPRERARVQRSIYVRPRPSSVRGISGGREREVLAKVFLESLRRGKEAMSIWVVVVVAFLAAVADSATIKARRNHVQDHSLALSLRDRSTILVNAL